MLAYSAVRKFSAKYGIEGTPNKRNREIPVCLHGGVGSPDGTVVRDSRAALAVVDVQSVLAVMGRRRCRSLADGPLVEGQRMFFEKSYFVRWRSLLGEGAAGDN